MEKVCCDFPIILRASLQKERTDTEALSEYYPITDNISLITDSPLTLWNNS